MSNLIPRLNKYIKIIPHPKQQAFLCLLCRDALYGGAAGGGKSIALLAAALQYVDLPNYSAIILRKSYKQLALSGALIDISHQWLADTDAKWLASQNTWLFPRGAKLAFGYLDTVADQYNYLGSAFHFVGIDEASQIREQSALYVGYSRARKDAESNIPLRFRCTSNPPTRDQLAIGKWVRDRYIVDPKPDTVFIPATLDDNPSLDRESYAEGLSVLDPITRRQLLFGDWFVSAEGGLFSPNWFTEVLPHQVPPLTKVVRYWDLASTKPTLNNRDPDYTVGVKMGRSKEGEYYILNVVRFRETPAVTERKIREVAEADGRSTRIYIEQEPGSSGKTVISNYVRQILPGFVVRGNRVTGNKMERAAPFSSMAENGHVYIVKSNWNKDYLEELQMFPDATDAHDDQVDASSGAFEQLFQRNGRLGIRIVNAV